MRSDRLSFSKLSLCLLVAATSTVLYPTITWGERIGDFVNTEMSIFPKHNLHSDVVQIVESGEANGFIVNNQQFKSSTELLRFLASQENHFYQRGILLTYSSKSLSDDDPMNSLSRFCEERDIDFFVNLPMGKVLSEEQVRWIVKSTHSSYQQQP